VPFKNFVAGEILTASDVNVHLSNQAISVFADASARDTAITSPVEGQFAFRTDDDVLEYWSGSAWEEYVSAFDADFLVVAGGGSGGRGDASTENSGGGGAGGVYGSEQANISKITLTPGVQYSLLVGGGASGLVAAGYGNPGNPSQLGSVIVPGGGGGLTRVFSNFARAIRVGASAGGGGNGVSTQHGTSGIAAFFGTGGGSAANTSSGAGNGGGGGGGAGANGNDGTTSAGGNGGIGFVSTIISASLASSQLVGQVSGSDVYFGGGGGGSRDSGSAGAGGLGGGGAGSVGANASSPGVANTGGGSGGASRNIAAGGGSGVIIFRIPARFTPTFTAGVTAHVETVGSEKVCIIKAAGPPDRVTIG
jgi:hypothetical protein